MTLTDFKKNKIIFKTWIYNKQNCFFFIKLFFFLSFIFMTNTVLLYAPCKFFCLIFYFSRCNSAMLTLWVATIYWEICWYLNFILVFTCGTQVLKHRLPTRPSSPHPHPRISSGSFSSSLFYKRLMLL